MRSAPAWRGRSRPEREGACPSCPRDGHSRHIALSIGKGPHRRSWAARSTMKYDHVAIPDADVPRAVEPVFQHALVTYASEVNKTAGVWRAVPDDLLDFRPHEKTNAIRTILVH